MTRVSEARSGPFDVNLLKKVLSELGYKFYYYPKTDSTMKTIEERTLAGASGAIVALTDHQTVGVGREGRKWLDSPNCSLLFSVLYQIPQSAVAAFADLVALTICQALRSETGTPIQIKYPNDLVVEDKKFGGILVKNIYNEKLHYLGTNVGIGLNVHYTLEELDNFPTDYPATSLDVFTKSFVSRQDLLIEILRSLRFLSTEVKVFEANSNALESFEKIWKEASSILGRKVSISKHDQKVAEGLVVNTGIGKGIELQTKKEKVWFSLYGTDMKARIIN